MNRLSKWIASTTMVLALGVCETSRAGTVTTKPATTQPDIKALLNDPMVPKYSEEFARKQAKAMEAINKYAAEHAQEIRITQRHEQQQKWISRLKIGVLAAFVGIGSLICVRVTKRRA